MSRHENAVPLPAATVTVRLPALLVDLFPGARREVAVQAVSVREVMDELDRLWPGMRDRLCDTRPAIPASTIKRFVDGERVKIAAPSSHPAPRMWVLTAISGG